MRTGIDIVEVERFENKSTNFLERVFTQNEIAYCTSFSLPAEHFAGFFAVKEAVMKVLGEGIDSIPFKDIEVCHNAKNRPYALLSGKAKALFESLGLTQMDVSISHTKYIATAIAVVS